MDNDKNVESTENIENSENTNTSENITEKKDENVESTEKVENTNSVNNVDNEDKKEEEKRTDVEGKKKEEKEDNSVNFILKEVSEGIRPDNTRITESEDAQDTNPDFQQNSAKEEKKFADVFNYINDKQRDNGKGSFENNNYDSRVYNKNEINYNCGTYNGRYAEEEKDRDDRLREELNITAKHGLLFGSILVVSVILGFIIGGMVLTHMLDSKSVLISTTSDKMIDYIEEDTRIPHSVAGIAKSCKSSVVAITTQSTTDIQTFFGTYRQSSVGSGSGVIVGKSKSELLIVTNNHVVDGATSVSICFNDDNTHAYSGIVKGTDPNNDLAIVSIDFTRIDKDVLRNITVATIGDSDTLEIGDEVVAIGNAMGMGQTVTTGIISAKSRNVKLDNGITIKLLQTDAAINPGNSGGALFNRYGELIGINTAKYASERVEGIGFAIPISEVRDKIESLMTKRTRERMETGYGSLSIVARSITDEYTVLFEIPCGAFVTQVGEGGASQKAGLMKGDIIVEFDDVTIDTVNKLVERLHYYKPGEIVELKYLRLVNGEYTEYTTNVTLDRDKVGIDESKVNNDTSNNAQNLPYQYNGDLMPNIDKILPYDKGTIPNEKNLPYNEETPSQEDGHINNLPNIESTPNTPSSQTGPSIEIHSNKI